jgi:tRNA(Arg) A34 adenosine deaminase TadA
VKPLEPHGHTGDLTRRGAAGRLVALLTGAIVVSTTARARAAEIVQPPRADPAAFMERAFEMRRLAVERGDQPYGAVVVRAGRIVGEGVSAVVTGNDPTAHAEMQAIRDAAHRLGTRDLSRCDLYGTSRACTMCEAAAYWAGIARMLHGATITDAGAPQLR